MSPHPREEESFVAALDLPPAERTAYIATQCGADNSLHARVESLVKAHEDARNFMETSPAKTERSADAARWQGKRDDARASQQKK